MTPALRRAGYDPAHVPTGIVHVGPGVFHRAHRAAMIDDLLSVDPDCGIAAVSLRSGSVTDALVRQDGRDVLRLLDDPPADRLIAAHRAALAPAQVGATIEPFADPGIRLVTATVTEKGYCRGADGGVDRSHPDTTHDAADATVARSLPGPTLMSCDDLPGNSAAMRPVVLDVAGEVGTGLVGWIEDECAFVDTMVDAITPAAPPVLVDAILADHGLADAVPVHRELYAACRIDAVDDPAVDAPGRCGAAPTRDVARWAAAKLRLLDGSHSLLAYAGLLAGHDTVDRAIADPPLAEATRRLMREAAETLTPPDGLDLDEYAATMIARFANPPIGHRLRPIATDGSQKLSRRIVAPVGERLAQGRASPALMLAIASWMAWLFAEVRAERAPGDPIAARLTAAGRRESVADAVADLLAIESVFPRSTVAALAPGLTPMVAVLVERRHGLADIIEGRVG